MMDSCIKCAKNVFNIFYSYSQSYQFLGDTAFLKSCFIQLLVSGRGRMNNKRFCVSNVCNMGPQLSVINKFFTSFKTAFNTESYDRPITNCEVFICLFMRWLVFQAREIYPFYSRMIL